MAESQYDIRINTTGGNESQAEVAKASQALNNITTSSSHMQSKFQEKFQHMGLVLFAKDALVASGLGAETRGIIQTMNLAITGVQTAAGISSGGIMLLVVALGALVGIAAKVIDHHKSITVELEKQFAANEKAASSHFELAQAMTKAQDAGYKLTDQQKDLLAAEQRVINDIKDNQLEVYGKLHEAIMKQVPANIAHIQAINLLKGALQSVTDFLADFLKGTVNLAYFITGGIVPSYNKWAEAIQYVMGKMKGSVSETYISQKQAKEIEQQTNILIAKSKEYSDVMKHTGESAQQYYERLLKMIKEQLEKEKQAQKAIQDAEKKTWDLRIADARAFAKEHDAMLKKVEERTAAAGAFIGTTLGTAFAQSIVEGKNMSEQLQSAMTNMAEHIIEAIIEIIVKVLALIAVWSILDIVSGGATGSPMNPGALSNFVKGGLGMGGIKGHATGGTEYADKPTLALFGEGGPEVATFTPLSGGGSSGGGDGSGGGNTQINHINVNVSGVIDDKMVNKIGLLIIQSIRGGGQLSFVR